MACGILVVEDDAELREMMAELLRCEGFEPACACNGLEALDRLKRGFRPHVILLDLMMPVMDGWQFRREQEKDPAVSDIPVVVATAAPLEAIRPVHATAVLQKPLDFDETVAVIRQYC